MDFYNFLELLIQEQQLTQKTIMEPKEEKFMSLYEYLGKRAGVGLGGKVYKYSKAQRIKVQNREVNQGGYVGTVICYPVTFLQDYFTQRQKFQELKKYFD
jgi:hypothetical protein